MKMSCMMTVVVVSRVYTPDETHVIVCFEWKQFILCKIYLIKIIKIWNREDVYFGFHYEPGTSYSVQHMVDAQ